MQHSYNAKRGTLRGMHYQAAPHQEAVRAVQAAPVKHADETSWQLRGKLCWLWVAATKTAALFHIDRGRNWHGLQALLGEQLQGTICSDRHCLYYYVKLSKRGVCWAHLKRDFVRWTERPSGCATSFSIS